VYNSFVWLRKLYQKVQLKKYLVVVVAALPLRNLLKNHLKPEPEKNNLEYDVNNISSKERSFSIVNKKI